LIEHTFPQIADAFALPLKFFYARLAQCGEIEQWKQGEDETQSILKNALKKLK
jgi:hypothetical protein